MLLASLLAVPAVLLALNTTHYKLRSCNEMAYTSCVLSTFAHVQSGSGTDAPQCVRSPFSADANTLNLLCLVTTANR